MDHSVQRDESVRRWMLVKSNFSRLCKTVCVCVSSPCSHDVKIIYSIYLKRKDGDHHSTQTSTARTRLVFSMFQIYILFVLPRKRSTFKNRFENKRGRTLQLLRLFGFIRLFPSHVPVHAWSPWRHRNKQRSHTANICPAAALHVTVFQPSAKRETEETDGEDGGEKWRRRRDEWLKQERKNTTSVQTCPHPSPPPGNVTWSVGVCV